MLPLITRAVTRLCWSALSSMDGLQVSSQSLPPSDREEVAEPKEDDELVTQDAVAYTPCKSTPRRGKIRNTVITPANERLLEPFQVQVTVMWCLLIELFLFYHCHVTCGSQIEWSIFGLGLLFWMVVCFTTWFIANCAQMRMLAVCMAAHERLGEQSGLACIPMDLMQVMLNM